jgi:hypothetical protein
VQPLENLQTDPHRGRYRGTLSGANHLLFCWTSNFDLADLIEEQRKHAILSSATLLCARKLIKSIESDKPNLAKQYSVDKAIEEAEFILGSYNFGRRR